MRAATQQMPSQPAKTRRERRKRRRLLHTGAYSVSALAMLIGGCSYTGPTLTANTTYERDLRNVAMELDALAQDLDAFGTVSVSSPGLLIDLGDHAIAPLTLPPEEFLQAPSVQGFSASNRQRELQLQASARLKADPAALPNTDQKTAELTTPPDLPSADGSRVQGEFSPRLNPPDPADLALSRRQRIILGKDDQAALAVANLTAAPPAELFGADKIVYAAIMSVSLRPGRETYRNHIAEIEVSPTFAWRDEADARNIKVDSGHSPQIFGVFPSIDSQVLDLRGSERRIVSLIAQLEASAPQAAGQLHSALRNLQENDRGTLEARNTVIGYNSTGFSVGWRFSPRFTAQADPAARSPSAGNQLFEQSFPALVYFVVDKQDLCEEYGGPKPAAKAAKPSDSKDEAYACASGILIRTTTRWLRAPDPAGDSSWVPFSGSVSRANQNRLTETRAVDWAIRLDRAKELIWAAYKFKTRGAEIPYDAQGHALRTLRARYNSLLDGTIGSDVFLPLPKPKARKVPAGPQIASVSPAIAWAGEATRVIVSGRGFLREKGQAAKCTGGVQQKDGWYCPADFFLGGRPVTVKSVSDDGRTAELSVPKMANPPVTPITITMNNADVGTATLANAISFTLKPPAPKPDGVKITRDGLGNVTSVTVEGKPPKDVLRAIEPATPKQASAVTIDVRAGAGQ